MRGEENCRIQKEMAMIFLYRAVNKISVAGKEAIYGFADGDELQMMLMGLKRFTKTEPYNLKNSRRKVADYLLKENKYAL
jgi:hypothetical protein